MFNKLSTMFALLFSLLFVYLNSANAQEASNDTVVVVYANFADQITINVPKNYVNAMSFKYGFDWKALIVSRLTKVAQDALKEYEENSRKIIDKNLDDVLAIDDAVALKAALTNLKNASKGFVRTVDRTLIPTYEGQGYIIIENVYK